MSIENPVIYVPIRHSTDQGTNIRLRLCCSFRLLSFGYVLNDDLRLTQPILPQGTPYGGAAQPSNETQSTNYYVRNYQGIMQNKPNLKDDQMNINIYYTKAYNNETAFRRGKNKPNSKPIKPNLRKAKMNVNLTLTKDYRKNDCLATQKTNPIQTQFLQRPVLLIAAGFYFLATI